jgi:hypothetical protein
MIPAHRLSAEDIRALANPATMPPVVGTLVRAQQSKHRLWLAAVMREAARTVPTEYHSVLEPAYLVLATAERNDPRAVMRPIASAQFGGWAADCLGGLQAGGTAHNLGRLADFAVNMAPDPRLPCLVAQADGLRFEVLLDDRDPHLDRYGLPRQPVTAPAEWQDLLARAWAILVAGHRDLATLLPAVVSTLVPLQRRAPPGRPVSSTVASCFGAIALSLPENAVEMAETLVHEFHHAVLSAAMDVTTLIHHHRADALTYAPWRDDPRPVGALLQGCYAHLGITGFWRRQREYGSRAERLRAHVEFARWRVSTAQATDVLLAAGILTSAGRVLAGTLRATLTEWLSEPVPTRALLDADDISAQHRALWMQRHLLSTA